nr:hypothetical protein [Gluconobacter sp. P5E10]
MQIENNTIRRACIAMGGVSTKPWCVPEAEAFLEEKTPSPSLFRDPAECRLSSDVRPDPGCNTGGCSKAAQYQH